MSAALTPEPTSVTPPPRSLPASLRLDSPELRRMTVGEFDRITAAGLWDDHGFELLDGLLVKKMPHHPAHDATLFYLDELVIALGLQGWIRRVQMAMALSTSRPEPDLLIARDHRAGYFTRLPSATEAGLLVEVADATVLTDRTEKLKLYAADGVAVFWIVNIPERRIEVYSRPLPNAAPPTYAECQIRRPGETITFELDGQAYTLAVSDIFPSAASSTL